MSVVYVLVTIAPVVVLVVGLAFSLPYWTEKRAYLKGLVYVYRRNAQSTLVQFWVDVALIVTNVAVFFVLGTWVSLLLIVVLSAVGYFNWRMYQHWRTKMDAVLSAEVSKVKIPDTPEGLL